MTAVRQVALCEKHLGTLRLCHLEAPSWDRHQVAQAISLHYPEVI